MQSFNNKMIIIKSFNLRNIWNLTPFLIYQIAGPYVPQFEIYWKKLDPNDTGKVAPMEAATFLKNSGLSDQTLGKVI